MASTASTSGVAADSNVTARMPAPDYPISDGQGKITIPWYYFLISIYGRTGGGPGISTTALQQQVGGLFVQEAMEDDVQPFPTQALGTLEQQIAGVGVQVAMIDEDADEAQQQPKQINPIIAALLVSDTYP